MPEEPYHLFKCRTLIEEKLGWGNSADWQNQDFENLSERIFAETKVLLSVSTLKRIWGKVRYQSTPNAGTLNALAQFLGYPNWRAFIAATSEPIQAETIENNQTPSRRLAPKNILLIIPLVVFVIFAGFWLGHKKTKFLHFENIQFTSKPVTIGLPNTVIFQYDASHSNADSIFIQQSWDSRRRFKVDKQLHEYTSTYYLPGYYKAKLILNDSIVKEHDVYIPTEGWIGMVMKNPVPVYLPKDLFAGKSEMVISEKELLQQKIDMDKEVPAVVLAKVDKSIDVSSDRLSLLVQLKNTYKRSNGICQKTFITLFGTEGVIEIPLCKIGCVGEIGLVIGMKFISGKTNDLSKFGVDFKDDVTVRCKTKDEKLQILINGSLAYSSDFKQNIGRIVGAKITFLGTGVVRHFELN